MTPHPPRPTTAQTLALCALLALAALPPALHAAQAEPPQAPGPEPTTMPLVRARVAVDPAPGKDSLLATDTRIGKSRTELRDLPQSLTAVTEKLIDDRNLETLKDSLKNTAGVSFLAAEGGEEDIRLRGFSLQATGDIFVDGLRDPAFYERDSFHWDRLEVLRGSASLLFGRGSTGGAVNQVSKQPRLFQPSEVAVTLGSGGHLRATADLNTRTGESAALRINAMQQVADRPSAGTNKQGLAASLRWGIGLADEWLLSAFALHNRNGVNYGLPWLEGRMLPGVDPRADYSLLSDIAHSSADTLTLGHTKRLPGQGEWRSTLRLGRFERDQRASAVRLAPAAVQPGGVAAAQANFGGATVLRRSGGSGTSAKIQNLTTATLQSDLDLRFTALGQRHSLQLGLDASQDAFTGFAVANPASGPLIKPDVTVAQSRASGFVDESLRLVMKNRDFQARSLGLYAQDLVQLAPSWKALAGLRWDHLQGRYRSFGTAPPTQGSLTAERERSDALFSHRLGLLWQPTPTASYHASLGSSFNTSGDAYQYDAPGSQTAPEQSRNIELGAKLDNASGTASLRMALFHSTKLRERNRDEESVSPTSYVLSGQRHAAGLELDVAGRLQPGWEVFASWVWIPDARVDKASSVLGTTLTGERVGQRPGLTPRHTATLWSTLKLGVSWRLGGGLNLRSADTPQQSSLRAPGFATADAMAEYDAGAVAFKLLATNLANTATADMLYRGHYIPGKPRSLQFTTTARF